MSKYDALTEFLSQQRGITEYPMRQLDLLVPGGLAPSAFKRSAWWGNNDSTHPHCQAWAAAGLEAHPDFRRQVVRFEPTVRLVN